VQSSSNALVVAGLLLLSSCAASPTRSVDTAKAADARTSAPLPALVDELLRPPTAPKGRLTLVFVLDGLRPDSINAEDTPHLQTLREQGVSFSASHSVIPTVTRANAASLATGTYPARHGIIGNNLYHPGVDASRAFSSGDYLKLRELERVSGDRLLLAPSLGEILTQHGKKLIVVSSSGNGCAYLLNHRARTGSGVLINGMLEPGKVVAFPEAVNQAVLQRFGASPTRDGSGAASVDWAEKVLVDYVLPELQPDVILNWITQPDGAQHAHGPGSPDAVAAIRNADRNIGLVLEKLKALGLYDKTNVFVVSDHGFAINDHAVDVTGSLVEAGLKQSATSDDVVVASSQTMKLYVKAHDRARIRALVEHLQRQPWADVIFTHAANGSVDAATHGFVEGTFSLELIHQESAERGADILVSLPWSSAKSRFGLEGISTTDAYDGVAGPVTGDKAGHGSLAPWDVHNTWFAWGADVKDGTFTPVPVANVDLLPSVLALSGVPIPEVDGRIVAEAFEGGPDTEKIPVETRTYVAANPATGYRATIQVSEVGRHRYIDKSWRLLPRAPVPSP
jgi:predicted AlkP superfamily pyrophosphatase or phosphodiesterase